MRRYRVIPVLMLHQGGLYKSVNFKNHRYVGDPINAIKIRLPKIKNIMAKVK